MSSKGGSATLADAMKTIGDVMAPGAKLGLGLLESIRLPSRVCGCGCEIPPPCWAPQPLGDVESEACPGNDAVLRLTITNCGMTSRTITVEGTNSAVKVEPASLTLGPMEDGMAAVTLAVPVGATKGQTQKSLVWIHGCQDHYLRWTVVAAEMGVSCCADEVELEDCPDLIHHWYDHFYCQRPCLSRD
jgi:hypothetical protein